MFNEPSDVSPIRKALQEVFFPDVPCLLARKQHVSTFCVDLHTFLLDKHRHTHALHSLALFVYM